MIVRKLRELIGTDRDVVGLGFSSRRLLLARDGQSYSMHDTTINAGAELHLWYKHHVESVYCVAGEGELENCETGEVHPISDGTFYCLDGHDKHILRAKTELRMICVFTPALVGPEVHDEDGAFPVLTEAPDIAPSLPLAGSEPAPVVRVASETPTWIGQSRPPDITSGAR
jgi:L-ectoine synthase